MISSATIYTLISGGLAENLRNKGVEEEIAGIEKVKDFQLSEYCDGFSRVETGNKE